MSKTIRFLAVMALFLLLVAAALLLAPDMLARAFMANPILNGFILGVLAVGVAYAFRLVIQLGRELAWIEDFQRKASGGVGAVRKPPRLVSPVATLLMKRKGEDDACDLSPVGVQTLLNGVAARLEEARETARYLVGLLVFLGLLGTFWGLMQTIHGIGDVITGIRIGGDDLGNALTDLKQGLQGPLEGMGIAFSSSLFGLSGSLIMGFLALQAGQAQNLFYQKFEAWLLNLASVEDVSGASTSKVSAGAGSAYVQALLEQTAENLESLHRLLAHEREERRTERDVLKTLSEQIARLRDVLDGDQMAVRRMVEEYAGLRQSLSGLSEIGENSAHARAALRNIEGRLDNMATEFPRVGAALNQDLRSEIRLLARTLSALTEKGDSSGAPDPH